MNIIYYKNFNKDLIELSEIELNTHYLDIGNKEYRIYNEESFDKYYNFNLDFYIKNNNDLKFNNNYLYRKHFYEHGINENRIYNIEIFYIFYPNFDLEFYKSLYNDLKNLSNIDLYSHYHTNGKFEDRFNNLNDLNNRLLTINFNLEYFKKLNPQINFNSDIEYLFYFCNINSSYYYYTYNFVIDNYNKSIDNTNPFYDLIKNQNYYRKISNYTDLLEYNSKFKKEYYFCNKESFYRYYNDFDYEYYKNRYFKDSNLSEVDILAYYHLKGKYQKEIINRKYKIIIYTLPFDISCGGIVVMHYLAKVINDYNHANFYAKLFVCNNLQYDSIFCNDFADINEINDNTIVIYPEIVNGNPLNCKTVVRWILLELGIEMPIDHFKNWEEKDLIYHWEPKNKLNSKILRYHWINPIFMNKNLVRSKTCYLIKKGRLVHNIIKNIHPIDSINLDNLNLEEIVNIFNESIYFYCYDPKTMYIIFSIFCGCIPVIYPIENISKIEYLEQSIFKKDDILYDKGIAYGNSLDELNYAIQTLSQSKDELMALLESDKITVNNFLDNLILYLFNSLT